MNYKKENLTLRYSTVQFTYWAASTGATSFATIYLLDRGLSSGIIGVLLAVSGILSCLIQPFLASAADRAEKVILIPLQVLISVLCIAGYAAQLLGELPVLAAGMIYVATLCCSDAMAPLLNAMSVAYNQAGYEINYGAARGVGALASAFAALALGNVFAHLGKLWMILFLLLFRFISLLLMASFPKIKKQRAELEKEETSCSIWYFFSHYRWYCASLLAVLFLGMYHAMTENYMIAIMQRLGGNSSHVGTAIFVAGLTSAPVIFFYGTIRKQCGDAVWMKTAAISFLIKSVGFYLAPNIYTIYALQLLQITSYGLLGPAQVYYAKDKVKSCDMVKGQAFITAAYALGCSMGNFAGGQLLNQGVGTMLLAGIVMAFLGTVLMFLTVNKKDR